MKTGERGCSCVGRWSRGSLHQVRLPTSRESEREREPLAPISPGRGNLPFGGRQPARFPRERVFTLCKRAWVESTDSDGLRGIFQSVTPPAGVSWGLPNGRACAVGSSEPPGSADYKSQKAARRVWWGESEGGGEQPPLSSHFLSPSSDLIIHLLTQSVPAGFFFYCSKLFFPLKRMKRGLGHLAVKTFRGFALSSAAQTMPDFLPGVGPWTREKEARGRPTRGRPGRISASTREQGGSAHAPRAAAARLTSAPRVPREPNHGSHW